MNVMKDGFATGILDFGGSGRTTGRLPWCKPSVQQPISGVAVVLLPKRHR
jgi:hypothetical protein